MAAFHATSLEANPALSAEWIEAQRPMMSSAEFASEYLADFVGSGGGFLDLDQVGCVSSAPVAPRDLDHCVLGLDPGQRDGFGVALVGLSVDPPARLRLAMVDAWDASKDFTGTVDRAARLAREWGAQVVTDQHSGAMVADRLRAQGVAVRVRPWAASSGTRAVGKFEAYADMRNRLYDGRLELLDDAALLAELGALRLKAAGGSWRVVSPRRAGSHGDRASALALAVAHATEPFERGAWLSDAERLRRDIAEIRRREIAALRAAESSEQFFGRTGPAFERGMAKRGLQW
jgi:hypothetical protein